MNDQAITFADPETRKCPFPAYEKLQVEAPVYFDPVARIYVLTRYQDCRMVLMDPRRFSSSTGLVMTRANAAVNRLYEKEGWAPIDVLTSCDPPEHRHYRALVDHAFGAKRVAALDGFMEKIANDLIDAFPESGEVDFVTAYAMALPLHVIADLVGVPHEIIPRLTIWANAAVATVNPTLSEERELELARILIESQHYFADRAEELRKQPEDETLFSRLVHSKVDGRPINTRELLSILQTLMVAGYETTTSTIASSIRQLIEQPGLVEQFHDNPDKIPAYVEEVLRLYAPLQGLPRMATEDVDIDGVKIPKGALLLVKFGAANRDPRQFACPEQFEMGRANAKSHFTFGFGEHFCVGNQLARGENRISVRQITRKLKNLRYARGSESWEHMDSFVTWGPRSFHIAFDRR